jgi:hypothetical protein
MNFIRLLKISLPLLVAALLCGCQTSGPHYLSKPEIVPAEGNYVHAGSKITLPPTVGGFLRNRVTRYDVDSLDVSAGYSLISIAPINATTYVYPAPPLASFGSPDSVVAEERAHLTATEFERRKWEIGQVHPGAALVEQHDVVQTKDGRAYPGKRAVFEYQQQSGDVSVTVRSELYVFCFVEGKWAVAYRFTYPKFENASPKIQEFMEKWNWHAQPG